MENTVTTRVFGGGQTSHSSIQGFISKRISQRKHLADFCYVKK